MKNIIEETLEEFKERYTEETTNDWRRLRAIRYQEVEEMLRSSLQKAINAEKERCLGCVPDEPLGYIDEPKYQLPEEEIKWNGGFNLCRKLVINKIKEE